MAPNSSCEFPQWCWASCSVQPSGQNRVSCSGLLRSVSPWFWVSPRTDALQEAFRQAVPVHNHHHLWKGFSFLSGVSCVSMCACCLLSHHCKPQRKALTHILFSPHQVFIYVDKITLSFLFSSSALLAPSHMTAVASSPSPSSCPSAGLSPVVACLSCSGSVELNGALQDAASPVLRIHHAEDKSYICCQLRGLWICNWSSWPTTEILNGIQRFQETDHVIRCPCFQIYPIPELSEPIGHRLRMRFVLSRQ